MKKYTIYFTNDEYMDLKKLYIARINSCEIPITTTFQQFIKKLIFRKEQKSCN